MNDSGLQKKATIEMVISNLRIHFQNLVESKSLDDRKSSLSNLLNSAKEISEIGNSPESQFLFNLSNPLTNFIQELSSKPGSIQPDALRTLAQTLDFLWKWQKNSHASIETNTHQVLVVDDESLSLRATTFALESSGFEVYGAELPMRGFDLAKDQGFSLIVLDVDMPEMNGFQLCQHIKKLSHHTRTPIMFVTGLNSSEARSECLSHGGCDLISKPFSFAELSLKSWTWIYSAEIGS